MEHLDAGEHAAPVTGGRLLGLVDFIGEGFAPLDSIIGDGLDARQYADLSHLSEQRSVTPSARFYIRTTASPLLPDAASWKIDFEGGAIAPSSNVPIRTLRSAARPMGRHLMECAGNVRATRFGLISAADWTGVPLTSVLDQLKFPSNATSVLIAGFDEYPNQPVTSIPGASWIFAVEKLKHAGAFLATGMNGGPLTRDHGAPVRLMVPGWYGCTCIKWVNKIAPADETAAATSQMQEFAARTLQDGIPELARDFQPATIDHAAMPIRVERWAVAGRPKYRVVGILWGGSQPVKELQIRFNPDEPFVPVKGLRQTRNDPWTMWSHDWRPRSPGTYSIRLAVTDPVVTARKMDAGYYVRSVEIIDV